MLRLAVASRAETYARIREPLAARDIDVVHLDVEEQAFSLDPATHAWRDLDVDVGYVFPSRLMEGAVATVLLDIPWVNDQAAVLRSRNKAGVLARLASADLPVPRSVLISNPVDETTLEAVWHTFDGPIVIKPNSTTHGVGVARTTDLDSFLGIADYLELVHDFRATGDKSFLVQEFIADARDVRVMVIDGAVVGAVERKIASDTSDTRWKHNVHRGAAARPCTIEEETHELVERVAAVMDIPLLGVDLLLTSDGPVVSETNARPTIDDASKYVPDFYDRLAALVRETTRTGSVSTR